MGLMDLFVKRDAIYFPGCITYFKFREGFDLYRQIFSKLGISFKVLDEKVCSGLEVWEGGYDFEMRKIIRKNFELFKEQNVKRIIVTEPGCYKMFTQEYPEVLPYWDIEVINIWELILEKITKKPWLVGSSILEDDSKLVTFHDSCYLGRYSGIYGVPREILNVLGYTVKEMDNTMGNSFCCGSCGSLARVSPELANKIAKERLLQAKRIGVSKMVVIGFENYSLLKLNSGGSGVEVVEFGQVLADAMGMGSIETEDELDLEVSVNE